MINLDTAKLSLYGMIVVAFLTLGGWWHIRGIRIDNLRQEVSSLQLQLSESNARIRQAQEAVRIAGERLDAMRAEEREINEAVNRARRVEGSNETVNPSIRDAIDSINRVRRSGQTSGTVNPR